MAGIVGKATVTEVGLLNSVEAIREELEITRAVIIPEIVRVATIHPAMVKLRFFRACKVNNCDLPGLEVCPSLVFAWVDNIKSLIIGTVINTVVEAN